ncbi:hypothetical protein K1T36_06285 [Pseudomonas protegens]|uniref:hypothetical protein n=1 Tax=Pseudomonas protegens TaxID=380021 RepID=UPI001C6A2E96|nr:hypothetical protein [Pseudomonas protegens]QYN02761.1 hypothetical protein K1T36_06285 [Pseudomonas protegens]
MAEEKDVDQYNAQQNKSSLGTESKNPAETTSKTDETNWKTAAASIQHLKEVVVILSAAGVLIWLMSILTKLIYSIVDLFSEAVRIHSAPVTVVKTMDWHVLGLGISLIVGVSAISIILMKSVFSSGGKQTPDGLKLSDLPVGEFLESVKTWFKR